MTRRPRALEHNLAYVVAVVVMMLIGVAAVTAVTIFRPGADNAGAIATIVGFIAPTTLSLLAFMKSQETHLSVNSRLDGMLAEARASARAEGREEGRREERLDAIARGGGRRRTDPVLDPINDG